MSFKFSGHETFPCRYSWLPKAFALLDTDTTALSDDEKAMVSLGVGKNMVKSIRFWIQAMGMAKVNVSGGYSITELGYAILSRNGLDPFLEDIRTLWLIHWQLSTNMEKPLFAWHYMLNRWQYPDITRNKVLDVFQQESKILGRPLSAVTLGQHFDTFLHTYVPTRSKKGDILEDNLDCPLAELELIQKIGHRQVDNSGKVDSIYAFNRDEKPEITPQLFIYCLNDYWLNQHRQEMSLSFHHITSACGSPGQIFKLSEQDIRQRLENIESDSHERFLYKESAQLPMVLRKDSLFSNLSTIYEEEVAYV